MNVDAANRMADMVEKAIRDRLFSAESFELYTNPDNKYSYHRIYVGKYIVYYTLSNDVMIVRRFLLGKVNAP